MDGVVIKVCTGCKFPRPIEQFHIGVGKGGRIARCRYCKNAAAAARKPRTIPAPGDSIWTQELVAKLRELVALNLPQTEIASRLGLTKNQVAGKVDRDSLMNSRSRDAPFTTMRERLDALHAKLDAALREK